MTEEGNAEIRLAQERKNRDGEKEARVALNRRLDAAYLVELGEVRAAEEKAWAPRMESVGPTAAVVSVPASASSMTRGYAAYRKYLESGPNLIRRTAENEALTGRKDELGGGAEKVDPYAKKMQELAAETRGVRAELDAVGQSQAWQTMTKAVTAADVEIARINAALGKVGLSTDQVAKMRAAFKGVGDLKAQVEWAQKIDEATKKLRDETGVQNLLTAAIGQGYEAVKRAHVEASVMAALGSEGYNDPEKALDAARVRAAAAEKFEAEHRERTATAVQGLRDQIELERALAAVVGQGADAVRAATLEIRRRQELARGVDQAEIAAEREQVIAERVHATAGAVAEIELRIAATERLTAAIGKGAAAVRQAALENKLAAITGAGGPGDEAAPGFIGIGQRGLATMREAGAGYGEELASKRAGANRVQELTDQIQKLTEAKALLGDTLGIEIQLRNLENERLRVLAEGAVYLGGARNGVRAFFLEMQQEADQTAKIIEGTLDSMVDRTAANLSKVFTGQKTDWAKSFQATGGQAVESV